MKHLAFAAIMLLFVVVIAQLHTPYVAALLVAAWVRYDGRLATRIF